MTSIVRVAALSAAVAIAAGAFAAHSVSGQPEEWLRTGAAYQLPHAAAAIGVSRIAPHISWLLLAGAAIFALSLYAMAFGAPRWLGAVAPVGGVLMISGWLWLAIRSPQDRR